MGPLSSTVCAKDVDYVFQTTSRGLRGIDLRVDPGQIVAVIGPNGSGKSTLVRLLGTELVPDSGRLELFGVPVSQRLGEARRRIGVVGDVSVHIDELTGRQNALFFARAYGLGRAEAATRVDPLLDRFGLTAHASEAVSSYSFGMRRRLLIASALAHAPDLLVLDEPAVGLDAAGQLRLREALEDRAHNGAAVVMATNLLTGLVESADRVIFLLDGRVVADASPVELLRELDGVTMIEIAPGQADLQWQDIDRVDLVQRNPVLRFESRHGTEPLPSLLRALIDAGAPIDSVSITEPGLADAFEVLTGQSLRPEQEPPKGNGR